MRAYTVELIRRCSLLEDAGGGWDRRKEEIEGTWQPSTPLDGI